MFSEGKIPMNSKILLVWVFIFALAISGCSSELSQQPAATSTLPADPEPDPVPDPIPDPEVIHPTLVPTNSVTIPVTWARLNLKGTLIYSIHGLDEKTQTNIIRVHALDLETGSVSVLYSAPKDAGIYYVSASQDNRQIVISYSPPLQSDPRIVEALYTLPLEGSKPPELLFMPAIREDQYIQAEWSPDGKYIYYTFVNYIITDPTRLEPFYKIFRMEYPGGEPELIAEAAYWPRLSFDSSRLVYVAADPVTAEHQLKIADPDGKNVQDVVLTGSYIPVLKDAPFFSPDGKSIIFSGDVPGAAYQPNWFEKLAGLRVAQANGEASDWWSVPITGGEITRLTYLYTVALYGSVSPDNKYVVSYSRDNIFVMNPDGSEITVILPGLGRFFGTVSWIP